MWSCDYGNKVLWPFFLHSVLHGSICPLFVQPRGEQWVKYWSTRLVEKFGLFKIWPWPIRNSLWIVILSVELKKSSFDMDNTTVLKLWINTKAKENQSQKLSITFKALLHLKIAAYIRAQKLDDPASFSVSYSTVWNPDLFLGVSSLVKPHIGVDNLFPLFVTGHV